MAELAVVLGIVLVLSQAIEAWQNILRSPLEFEKLQLEVDELRLEIQHLRRELDKI